MVTHRRLHIVYQRDINGHCKNKIPNVFPTIKLKRRCEEGHGVEGAERGTRARTEQVTTTLTRQPDPVRNYDDFADSYIIAMLIVTLSHDMCVSGFNVHTFSYKTTVCICVATTIYIFKG